MDIDGVLTTLHSRRISADTFNPVAVKALNKLLDLKPSWVAIHSSWRKVYFPGYFVWNLSEFLDLCESQGLNLKKFPVEEVPYKLSTYREVEVKMYLASNPRVRAVVLDDELYQCDFPLENILVVTTADATGLLESEVDEIEKWLTKN